MPFDDLECSILTDSLDDWLMIGSAAQSAVVRGYGRSSQQVKGKLLRSIEKLLAQKLIRLGDITAEGAFAPWSGSQSDALVKLTRLLEPSDPDSWYAVAWIDLTDVGKRVASEQFSG